MFSLNQEKVDTQENLTEQQHALETSIVKLLVSEYEGVEEVSFNGWGYSPETGSWGTIATINKNNIMDFSFDGLSGLEELDGRSYYPDTFKLVRKPGVENLPGARFRVDEIEQTSIEGIKITHSKKRNED
ncbi:hypothetical protein [Streptococcus sp. CSL10205-OR2]|uniref:hypothetical protein n=1 Tax=Streptococcus sp. CSL10205-OR2 TaxID=2980558 RepID=UPI0021D9C682|nr:hypothetical protein [Streptococcus sp. CSL10205-OR2]MCU9533540.1 hypothetical protein [Streptococcus sp. CSL10205-OR2]